MTWPSRRKLNSIARIIMQFIKAIGYQNGIKAKVIKFCLSTYPCMIECELVQYEETIFEWHIIRIFEDTCNYC